MSEKTKNDNYEAINEEAHAEDVIYQTIASTLGKKYEVIYYVNLDDDKYVEFNVTGAFRHLPIDTSGSHFFDECADNLKRVCYKDDYEKLAIITNKEVFLNRLGFDEFKSIEYRLLVQGKPTFYRMEAVRPSNDKNHIIVAASNINKEVAEMHRYKKQLSDARYDAEKANEAKSTFLFNVSHDIRTPLNVIKGFSDIALRNMNDEARVLDCICKIESASNHLLNLVNDVLDMSNIERGQLEIKEEKIDIIMASEEVNSMIKYVSTSKNISFTTKYDVKDKMVIADIAHVNQAIINVLTNAVKYTPEGGEVTFTIEQTTQLYGDKTKYRFIVKDNGIGMTEEFLKHIFEGFTMERSTTLSKSGGLGLGMAITKRLVDMMHGEIDIKSELDAGTTVTITLPFKIADKEGSHDGEVMSAEDVTLDGKHILIVEDNELNAEITAEILSDEGVTADIAENGAVAVSRLKKKGVKSYDLVLMDIQMPVMDGYEATRIIRNKVKGGSEIPIIALSANAFEQDKMNSIKAGMNAHVSKPVNADVLCEVIKTHLVPIRFD